jgi:hypothetical protein
LMHKCLNMYGDSFFLLHYCLRFKTVESLKMGRQKFSKV